MNLNSKKNISKFVNEYAKNKSIALVYGNFNVIHPGHLRLLNFASDCADILIVGVLPDSSPGVHVSAKLRLEGVKSLGVVTEALILDKLNIYDLIDFLRPHYLIKGKEYEHKENHEISLLDKYGGKLLFASGEVRFSSFDLINNEIKGESSISKKNILEYVARHKLDKIKLLNCIKKFNNLNVLVIGDLIIDEYVTCEPLGMSQEDPTIVITPLHTDKFIGGAGVVALHASTLGACVTYIGIVGNDDEKYYAQENLKLYNLDTHLFTDNSRPTTLKKRFRAKGKTLLRVSYLKQHPISQELINKIYNVFLEKINNIDLVIFSDFNYGCLPQDLIDKIISKCDAENIPFVADSQSSSQIGDITKFKGSLLITPTEREARVALKDNHSGLIVLINKIIQKSQTKYCALTMGEEGVFIHHTEKINSVITDQIPAFNNSPKDVSGAGDSFFVTCSMSLIAGASIWEAAYLGSSASACQVSRLGNIPLNADDLNQFIDYI